jgi:coenzyme F420 hydrogenase subunit beta
MSAENPLEPEPFIATTAKDIINASGAKYCPVPTNVAIREILRNEGAYAVVGLPCQIHGMKNAEIALKKLRERVRLHLGIFCNHAPTFWATRLLLTRLGVDASQVAKIDYRGQGWPGATTVKLKEGSTKVLQDYWTFPGSDLFTSKRCLLCCDLTSELADVSFGDPWNLDIPQGAGSSIVVARSEKGRNLLQEAEATGIVDLRHAVADQVKQSQLRMLYVKKRLLKARMKLYGTKVKINADLIDPDLSDYVLAFVPCFVSTLSQNRLARMVASRLPQDLLLLYTRPTNRLLQNKLQKWKWTSGSL